MTITVKAKPGNLAISLATIKTKHLRITSGTLDDASIQNVYIPSAIRYFEEFTNRALITQTLIQTFDGFPCDARYFYLERMSPKVEDVETVVLNSIYYYNNQGVLTEFDSSNFIVNHDDTPVSIQLLPGKCWPSDIDPERIKSVRVDYTCGYGDDEGDVPEAIHHCLAMLVATSFNFREDDLYSPGGTIAQPSKTSINYLRTFKTGFHELRGQSRRD